MMKRAPFLRHTVLLVGKGKTEEAFLNHLKALYLARDRGVAVKIRGAGGTEPEYIVNHAVRIARRFAPDRILVLLDTDVPIEKSVRKKAARHAMQLIESKPCLEGLLLAILGKRVPAASEQCKQLCAGYFGSALTEQSSYSRLTHALLEKRRNNVPTLTQLLDSFSFDK